MNDDDRDFISGPRCHLLDRTSAKGDRFLGRCRYCGQGNLPARAALERCPGDPEKFWQDMEDTIVRASPASRMIETHYAADHNAGWCGCGVPWGNPRRTEDERTKFWREMDEWIEKPPYDPSSLLKEEMWAFETRMARFQRDCAPTRAEWKVAVYKLAFAMYRLYFAWRGHRVDS